MLKKVFLVSLSLLIMFTGFITGPFLSATVVQASPLSTLVNGGFESAVVDGKIPGWSFTGSVAEGISYEVSKEQKVTGEASLKLIDTLTNGTAVMVSDLHEITAGQTYKGTAEVYIASGNVASISLRYYDEAKKQITMPEIVTHNEPGKGFPVKQWKTTTTPKTVAPNNARYAQVVLSVSSFGTATAYFDHASIEAVEAEEPISTNLRNPGFEKPQQGDKIEHWTSTSNPTGAANYYELSDEIVYSGNYSLKMVDMDRTKAVSMLSDSFLVTPGDFYTGTGKLYVKSDTTSSISIKFYDANNKELSAGAVEIHNETSKGFPVEQWTDISTRKAIAPEGALYGKIYLYSTNYAVGEAYYDDIAVVHQQDLNPASLSLAAPTILEQGEIFTVSLDASKLKGLNKLQASLFFDNQLIEFIDITAVDAFAAEGGAVTANASTGKVEIIATSTASVTANTGVAKLKFKAIADQAQAWIVLSKQYTRL